MTQSTVQARAIVVQTQEEERHRLAQTLQAGPAQLLANATLEIETYLQLRDAQPLTARAGLEALLRELQQGLMDLRGLIANLQPPGLEEFGLVASLQRYVEQFSQQTGIPVELVGWDHLTARLPDTVEWAIFRVAQEALDNVRKHAHANHARVEFENSANRITVTIVDNGRGFAATHLSSDRCLGLVIMQDRAGLLGGTLRIFSQAGKGTRVVLAAPRELALAAQ